MNVLYYKIWRDLWDNKARTVQVVLIIAMGAMAMGTIVGARNLTIENINAVWKHSAPPMMMLGVNPPINDNQLAAIQNTKGVAAAEGIMFDTIQWRLKPTDAWQTAALMGRDDYPNQKLGKVALFSGEWPSRTTFGMSKGAENFFNVHIGDKVYLKINDKTHVIKVGGTIFNQLWEPLSVGGDIQFFATREQFADLTGESNFVLIYASGPVYDEPTIVNTTNRISRYLERLDIKAEGSAPEGARALDPDKHFLQAMLDGIFLIMGMLGVATILLGLLLNYNTINAIVMQQVNQIGVMKAIGATTWQILGVYLGMVFIYSLCALIVSVPPATLAAYGMAVGLIDMFGIDPFPFTINLPALLLQLAIILLSPMAAAMIPAIGAARITVREAISTYGIGTVDGFLDRLMVNSQIIPRLIILILGNVFRNKRRLFFTQLTLASSGLIFMILLSVQASTNYTVDEQISAIHRYNVTIQFQDPERIVKVEKLTLDQPNVKAVEMWSVAKARIRPSSQPEMLDDDQLVSLFGMPAPTVMYHPNLKAGRWFEAGETAVIVLNQRLATKIGVKIGDKVTFYHTAKQESTWQVIGTVSDPLVVYSAYMPYAPLAGKLSSVNKANTIWVQITPNDD